MSSSSKLFTEEIHSKNLTKDQKRDLDAFFKANCSFVVDFSGNNTFVVVHDQRQIIFAFEYAHGSAKRGSFIEIYSVCTLVARRRQGIAKAVLEKFIEAKHEDNIIWLGIMPEKTAPYKLYTSLGFTNPRLSNKSPLGKTFNFRFISFIYNPFAQSAEKKQALDDAVHIIDAVAASASVARQPLKLSYTIFEDTFKNIRDENVENGGSLRLKPDGSLEIENKYVGQPNTLAVSFPPAPFVYHTHPIHAYKMVIHGIGTPSAPDFAYSLHPLVSAHLVIALEGSYLIQYSADFRMLSTYFAVYKPHCLVALQATVSQLFSVEYFRHLEYIVGQLRESVPIGVLAISQQFRERTHSIIKDYIKAVNALKLSDVLKMSKDLTFIKCVHEFTEIQDIPVCRIVFIPQSTIETHKIEKKNLVVSEIKM